MQDIRKCLSTRFLERLLHKRKVWESFSLDRWKERADEAGDETRCCQNFLSTAGNDGIKVVKIEILEDLDHKLRLKLTLSVLWRWSNKIKKMEVDILGWWCGNRTLRNPLCWNFEPFTSWLNSIEKDFQIQISADHNILKIGCSLRIWFRNKIKKWFNPIWGGGG